MPPCLLSSDKAAASDCGGVFAGLDENYLWFGNRADITLGTLTAATRTYGAITMAATTQLYRWYMAKQGFSFEDEMTIDENTGAISFGPRLRARMIGLSGQNAADATKLQGTNLVAFFKTKAGKIIVAGYGSGLTLVENTTGSVSETLGENIALGSDDEPGKHYELLITNLATTIAALVAAETPTSS